MVSGNRVTLLNDGVQCFPVMLTIIGEAEREILLEMYWFASDRTGRRFADALVAKAREGVRVRVIYDAVGSLETDGAMFDEMCAAGCEVLQYNPIAPWRQRFSIGLVNNRDHRKILVVDGRVAMTGGVNIGDPWASAEEGGDGWRDDMIRIEGPAAAQMRDVFKETWQDLSERGRVTSETGSPEGGAPSLPPPEATRSPTSVRVLASHYGRARRAIRREYLAQIRRASSQIYISNSYFVPDRVVRRALANAVARGVDVRVLVPGRSDVAAVYWAGRRLYGGLLRAGVRIYQWQRTILHAKTAVIDQHFCTVGSYNLDYRSWRSNLEVNVAIDDPALGATMARRFEDDLAEAVALDGRDWAFRPLSHRLLEWFLYLFRKLL